MQQGHRHHIAGQRGGREGDFRTSSKSINDFCKFVPDIWTATKRSDVMSRIRSRDTAPERKLHAALRRNGVRYRSHQRVAGIFVDVRLVRFRMVILVHGCFWHGCRQHYVAPSNHAAFWRTKVGSNRARDARQGRLLRKAGWRVVTMWEHSLSSDREADRIVRRLLRIRGKPQEPSSWSLRNRCSSASGPVGRNPASRASRRIRAP